MILTLCWILFLSTGPHAVYLATNSSENRPLVECSLIDASGGKFDALKESNLCRPNGTSMPNAYQVSNPVLPSKEFIFSTSAQFHSEITSARQDTSTSLQVDGLHSGSWGLPRQGTQSVFEEESLVGLLLSIITHTMRDCALTIAYDGAFSSRDLLRALFILPNPRLVVRLTSANDFNGLLWKSALCRGYIFLLSRSDILDAFSNRGDYVWDFGGRYVIVGLSKTELEALSISKKISKTENLLGVVKYPRLGEWGVYVNQVIRDVGVSRVALWRNGRFTNEPMFFLDQLDDLREKLLRVITFQWEPSVMYRKNKEGQVTELYGKDVMVVKALAQALNAKLVYLDVPKGEVWGTRVGNGTNWNGLMGYLQRGEADIGIANMFITNINNRMDVADFSTPFDAEITVLDTDAGISLETIIFTNFLKLNKGSQIPLQL